MNLLLWSNLTTVMNTAVFLREHQPLLHFRCQHRRRMSTSRPRMKMKVQAMNTLVITRFCSLRIKIVPAVIGPRSRQRRHPRHYQDVLVESPLHIQTQELRREASTKTTHITSNRIGTKQGRVTRIKHPLFFPSPTAPFTATPIYPLRRHHIHRRHCPRHTLNCNPQNNRETQRSENTCPRNGGQKQSVVRSCSSSAMQWTMCVAFVDGGGTRNCSNVTASAGAPTTPGALARTSVTSTPVQRGCARYA